MNWSMQGHFVRIQKTFQVKPITDQTERWLSPSVQRRCVSLLLAAILALALWLRTQEIGTVSYWFDESSSWKTIHFAWPEMLMSISHNVHPPVYYLLLRMWAVVIGDGPISLRMFSVLFGILTVLAAFWFVREAMRNAPADRWLSSDVAALFAATMIAVSPVHVALSLQARMYTLGTFLAIVSAALLLRICRSGGTAIEWTAVTATGLRLTLTHYYGIFTAASFVFFLVARIVFGTAVEGATPVLKRLLVGFFVASWSATCMWGLWLPIFLAQRAQVNRRYWVSDFEWHELSNLWTVMLTGSDIGAETLLLRWGAVGFLAFVSLLSLLCGSSAGHLAILAVILPSICAIAISLRGQNIIVWRYRIFSQTFLLLSWALLIGQSRLVALRLILMAMSIGWLSYWGNAHWQKRAWIAEETGLREAACMINDCRIEGEPVIVASSTVHSIIQRYANEPDDIFVLDLGYEYAHFLGGPLLKSSEYLSVGQLSDGPANRVFVVGRRNEVDLGESWHEVRYEEFERFGHPRQVIVRELERVNNRSG